MPLDQLRVTNEVTFLLIIKPHDYEPLTCLFLLCRSSSFCEPPKPSGLPLCEDRCDYSRPQERKTSPDSLAAVTTSATRCHQWSHRPPLEEAGRGCTVGQINDGWGLEVEKEISFLRGWISARHPARSTKPSTVVWGRCRGSRMGPEPFASGLVLRGTSCGEPAERSCWNSCCLVARDLSSQPPHRRKIF